MLLRHLIASALVAGLVAGATAYATIPGPDGSVVACYATNPSDPDRYLRPVDDASQCTGLERTVTLGARGPQGPQGAQGPPGVQDYTDMPVFGAALDTRGRDQRGEVYPSDGRLRSISLELPAGRFIVTTRWTGNVYATLVRPNGDPVSSNLRALGSEIGDTLPIPYVLPDDRGITSRALHVRVPVECRLDADGGVGTIARTAGEGGIALDQPDRLRAPNQTYDLTSIVTLSRPGTLTWGCATPVRDGQAFVGDIRYAATWQFVGAGIDAVRLARAPGAPSALPAATQTATLAPGAVLDRTPSIPSSVRRSVVAAARATAARDFDGQRLSRSEQRAIRGQRPPKVR